MISTLPRLVVFATAIAALFDIVDSAGATCWDGFWTEQKCCDPLHGPEGNKMCWDGQTFTFDRCCPQAEPVAAEWFRCVPTGSVFRAVAATVVLLLCVFFSATVDAPRRDVRTRERSAFLDNAKFLTMVSVVWVHLMDRSLTQNVRPVRAMVNAAGFQMPLFSMLSGTVSTRGPASHRQLEHLMVHTLVPLAFYVMIVYPVLDWPHTWFFGTAMEADPRQSLRWTYKDPWSAFFMMNRHDLGWYLRCLIIWRLGCPLLDVLALSVQAAAVLAIGVAGAYSNATGLHTLVVGVPISATSLLPFFWLGRQLDIEALVPRVSKPRWLLGWGGLVVLFCLYAVFEEAGNAVLGEHGRYSLVHLLAPGCPADSYFLWARFVVLKALHSAMAAFFLAFCVPRSRTFFSDHGRHTIYPYLLHTLLVVHPMCSWVTTMTAMKHWRPTSLSLVSCGFVVACLLLSFIITLCLSSSLVRRCFRLFFEPYWVLPSSLTSSRKVAPIRKDDKEK
eukprot:TRINITY_DN44405_c0_g1_i1.p1 TRINITY_DN44405_c0_g1~~TRINITY_DN44405_c0_g1_i1.p1  ORF type:complete len:502 (+),score=63.41 TRINITY_DN44405_c0_g1_i1:231-1736(+)